MAYKKRTDKKRQTLQKGEYVRKSDGRYCFKFWNEMSGKYTVIYADTLIELREKEAEIRENLSSGIDMLKAKTTTLNDLFYAGMKLKEEGKLLRPSTVQNYIGIWRLNCDEFGKNRAADITALQIRSLLAGFVSRGLSKSTVKLLHCLLSSVFEDAIVQKIRSDNPCMEKTVKRIKAAGVPEKQREALTPEEQAELLRYVRNSKIYCIYADMLIIALYTGLRVGELTGLTWNDIDLNAGTIQVERQLRYGKTEQGGNTHFYISVPKTEAGIRTVYFGTEVKQAFKHLRQINFTLGKTQACVEVDGIGGFIFLTKNGTPYATNAVNFILQNIVERHNAECEGILLPHISAHILRHSYATRALESGTDYKALQESLGHTKIGITLDIYAKPNDEEWKRRELLKIVNES